MTDIQIKHYNGTAWAELFPKTKARITELNSGKTVEAAIGELVSSLSSKVTIEQVDAEIEKIIGTAPAALDTLQELADALGKDPNFATTVTTSLGLKVDKVAGKGLSTNDFTTALQNKLNALPANAYTKAEVDTRINNLASSAIPVQSAEPVGATVWFQTI